MLLNSLVKFLFSPEIILGVNLILIISFWNNSVFRNIFLFVFIIILFLIWVSPLPFYLMKIRERQFPALMDVNSAIDINKQTHIIILGAGHSNDKNIPLTSQLTNEVAIRMMEGIRIYRQLKNAKFIGSGSADLENSRSQAEAVCDAAVSLGVNPDDTLYLPFTENTEGEVKDYLNRFQDIKDSVNIIVVTSAYHIPRAVFLFNKYGLNVIPAPCAYYIKEEERINHFKKWLPSFKKFELMDRVMDEWLGLQYAKYK